MQKYRPIPQRQLAWHLAYEPPRHLAHPLPTLSHRLRPSPRLRGAAVRLSLLPRLPRAVWLRHALPQPSARPTTPPRRVPPHRLSQVRGTWRRGRQAGRPRAGPPARAAPHAAHTRAKKATKRTTTKATRGWKGEEEEIVKLHLKAALWWVAAETRRRGPGRYRGPATGAGRRGRGVGRRGRAAKGRVRSGDPSSSERWSREGQAPTSEHEMSTFDKIITSLAPRTLSKLIPDHVEAVQLVEECHAPRACITHSRRGRLFRGAAGAFSSIKTALGATTSARRRGAASYDARGEQEESGRQADALKQGKQTRGTLLTFRQGTVHWENPKLITDKGLCMADLPNHQCAP